MRRQCGYVLTFGDIRKITFEDVKGWRRSFPKVTKVIFGGGWPGHPAEGGASSSQSSTGTDGFLDAMVQRQPSCQAPTLGARGDLRESPHEAGGHRQGHLQAGVRGLLHRRRRPGDALSPAESVVA